jgi:hypothetical protein
VESLSRKIKATKEAGLSIFLVSMDQTTDEEVIDTTGINIISVSNIQQAWCIASGQAPWQVVISK